MLSTAVLVLSLMPPVLLPPLTPSQARATRVLARLRGGSTEHGSTGRSSSVGPQRGAIYPWRAGLPAFSPGRRQLAPPSPPPPPSLAGEPSGEPAGKLTMLEQAADLWASRRTVLRGVLRPLLLLLRVKPPVGALLLLQAYQLLRHTGQTLTPTPTPNPNPTPQP